MYPSFVTTTPEPRPRCLGSCGGLAPRRLPGLKSAPKNRRKNGSSNMGALKDAFRGVELMKTFTTLGETFFTTGAKLVVSLVSRFRGALFTTTLGGAGLLV